MTLNNVNWEAGSNILHPIINLEGIKSSQQITPLEINKRFSTIRNNERALAKAVANLSNDNNSYSFVNTMASISSDIIEATTVTYNSAELAAAKENKHLSYNDTHVLYTLENVATSGTLDDIILTVFLDGRLLTETDYVVEQFYSSTQIFIDELLITNDSEVSLVAFKKFNEYGKSINNRSKYVVSNEYNRHGALVITRPKKDFGTIFSLKHIQVFNKTTNVLIDPSSYNVRESTTNISNIEIVLSPRVVSPNDNLEFFNTTEYGESRITRHINNGFTFVLTGSDGTELPRVDTRDLQVWVNGSKVDSNYITSGSGSNDYSLSEIKVSSIDNFFAFKSISTNSAIVNYSKVDFNNLINSNALVYTNIDYLLSSPKLLAYSSDGKLLNTNNSIINNGREIKLGSSKNLYDETTVVLLQNYMISDFILDKFLSKLNDYKHIASRGLVSNRYINSIDDIDNIDDIVKGEIFSTRDTGDLYYRDINGNNILLSISADDIFHTVADIDSTDEIADIPNNSLFVVSDTNITYLKSNDGSVKQLTDKSSIGETVDTISNTNAIEAILNNNFFTALDTGIIYLKSNDGSVKQITDLISSTVSSISNTAAIAAIPLNTLFTTTDTEKTYFKNNTGSILQLSNNPDKKAMQLASSGTINIDIDESNYFYCDATNAITFVPVNLKTEINDINSFILEIKKGGLQHITWWENIQWDRRLPPELSENNTTLLAFFGVTKAGMTKIQWQGIVLSEDSSL